MFFYNVFYKSEKQRVLCFFICKSMSLTFMVLSQTFKRGLAMTTHRPRRKIPALPTGMCFQETSAS